MGFITDRLGIYDKDIMQTLLPKLTMSLAIANSNVTRERSLSELWFGDSSPQWLDQLKSKLFTLCSATNQVTNPIEILGPHNLTDAGRILVDDATINVLEFTCHATELPDHQRYPIHDEGGMFNRSSLLSKPYRIILSPGWYYALLQRPLKIPTNHPAYSPSDLSYQRYSKLHILIHGLTHIVLETSDISEGYTGCLSLAASSSAKAKMNADNWAFFIEDAGRC